MLERASDVCHKQKISVSGVGIRRGRDGGMSSKRNFLDKFVENRTVMRSVKYDVTGSTVNQVQPIIVQ